jgi:hypothetical protein
VICTYILSVSQRTCASPTRISARVENSVALQHFRVIQNLSVVTVPDNDYPRVLCGSRNANARFSNTDSRVYYLWAHHTTAVLSREAVAMCAPNTSTHLIPLACASTSSCSSVKPQPLRFAQFALWAGKNRSVPTAENLKLRAPILGVQNIEMHQCARRTRTCKPGIPTPRGQILTQASHVRNNHDQEAFACTRRFE